MTSKKWLLPVKNFQIAILFLFSLSALSVFAQVSGSTTTSHPDVSSPARSKNSGPSQPGASWASEQQNPDDASRPTSREDLATPSLQGQSLPDASIRIGELDKDPDFTRELIRVQWRAGDPIDLIVVKPVGVTKPPVILYLYSYPSDTDRYRDRDFCKFLTQRGVAAVGFAAALDGPRYHDVPMKEWFVSNLPMALSASAHDVQLILNYLTGRGDLDMEHVGMFGDGSGASIAILAAAVDSRIKTLDLLDPWGDWPDWIAKSTLIPEKERPDYLKPDFLASSAPLDPVKWLPKLKTQKVRLSEVKSVTVTPEEARKKIEAAAPPNVDIRRYDDLPAFLKTVAGGKGFDWLKENVQAGAPAQFHASNGAPLHDSAHAGQSQP